MRLSFIDAHGREVLLVLPALIAEATLIPDLSGAAAPMRETTEENAAEGPASIRCAFSYLSYSPSCPLSAFPLETRPIWKNKKTLEEFRCRILRFLIIPVIGRSLRKRNTEEENKETK